MNSWLLAVTTANNHDMTKSNSGGWWQKALRIINTVYTVQSVLVYCINTPDTFDVLMYWIHLYQGRSQRGGGQGAAPHEGLSPPRTFTEIITEEQLKNYGTINT